MSENNDFPNFNQSNKKHSRKKKFRANSNHSRDEYLGDIIKLIAFENSVASRAKNEDIARASSLYNQIKKKFIKSKIAQIFFN